MSEYCDNYKLTEDNDHFVLQPDYQDNFQTWQNARGPYFTPSVDADGWLSFINNGGLPNPAPVQIVGRDGKGITLAGYAESTADLPEDPAYGDCWAVGAAEPYEAYAWFDEWTDLGPIFPPGEDGVSPTVTMTAITGGTRLTITDADHPGGQSTDIMNGDDGVSPAVTMTAITGGTRLTITDKDHPSGQTADIMNGTDGAPGPGVPAGGTAGQYLKKASSTDYDGTWDTLGADDVGYDGTQNYAAGTAGKKIKDLDAGLTLAEDSVTPYVVGNTNTTGSTLDPGTFVWVKNHSVLSDGLYTVKTTAIVSGGSVVDTNMEHVDAGGLNSLKNSLAEIVDFRVRLTASNNDLNSATASGIYTMYNPSNSPISGWVLLLTLSMIEGSYMAQLAFGFWDNVVYLRTADGGSWRTWKQL